VPEFGSGSGSELFSPAFEAKLLPPYSNGNHVLTAAKPAIAPLPVLLVGDGEEDFFLIRDMLERNRSGCAPEHDPETWKPSFGKDHAPM